MKTQMIMRWIAWSTIGVSLLLYVLACALPSGVVVGIDPEDEVRGIWCLVGGWTAVFGVWWVDGPPCFFPKRLS